MQHYRQGDVLLIQTRKKLTGTPVAPAATEYILARGEATGHAHTVDAQDAELYEAPDGTLYLRVHTPTPLRHQEHAPIILDEGTYRVQRQREYSPEEIRRVAD